MIDSAMRYARYLLIAPAVVPLVYAGGLMYPMLAPKTFLLEALGVVGLAAFLALAPRAPLYWERLRDWRVWLPGLLLLGAYISSLFGVDFYHSFWSLYERGDGLLMLTTCVLFFYLITLVADEKLLRQMVRTVAWVGSLAGAYVILQWLLIAAGIDLPFMAAVSGRIGGTMGNAAFLAAYLGITFFITRAALLERRGSERTWLVVGSYLQIAGILLTATRGTEFALIGAGVLALVYQAWRGGGVYQKRSRQALGALVVVGALFVLLRGPIAARAPLDSIRRLASISLSDATVSSRLFLWQHLIPEALKAPVLGSGAEQIATSFNRVYDPTQISEEWFDRSHNVYIDYLLQYGLVGLGLYLALICAGLMAAWQLLSRGATETERRYGPYLFLAILVYALQNIFVFDTGVVLWLFFALLALLFATKKSEARVLALPSAAPLVGTVLGVLALLLVWPVAIQPLRANRLAFDAYLYHVVDVAKTEAYTKEALALNTYADLELAYNAYFMYSNEQVKMLTGDSLLAAWNTAHTLLRNAYVRYPYDARTATYLLQVLDTAPAGATVDADFEHRLIAAEIDLSPRRKEAWYILANLSIAAANKLPAGVERAALYQSAMSTLDAYIKLVPALAEPHFVLADIHLALGDAKGAAAEAALGTTLYKRDLTTAHRAAIFYEKVGDIKNAAFFLQSIVEQDAGADTWRYDLAKAKYVLGDYAGAEVEVQYLRTHNPTLLPTDPAFVAAITAYEQSLK